jgi:hypothetical protein
MAKMDGLIGFDMSQSLPLPTDGNTLPNLPQTNTVGIPLGVPGGFSMNSNGRGLSASQNGMEILRTLSLSGAGLMMPNLPLPMSAPVGDAAEVSWERRPSGRVYDEEETSWLMDDRAG